jgi:hypothetical protein
MAETSAEQLTCMLQSLVTREGVSAIGVFAADQAPAIDKTMHWCFILNTEPRGQPGEHRLAFLYSDYHDTLENFDSHGWRFTHTMLCTSLCVHVDSHHCVRLRIAHVVSSRMSSLYVDTTALFLCIGAPSTYPQNLHPLPLAWLRHIARHCSATNMCLTLCATGFVAVTVALIWLHVVTVVSLALASRTVVRPI